MHPKKRKLHTRTRSVVTGTNSSTLVCSALSKRGKISHKTNVSLEATTGKLGSKVGPHYQPSLLVRHPPSPQDITLSLLLASQAHLGHAISLWNPSNQRYIFGVRQGIHIISLEIIAAHLRRAAKIVEGVAEKGGLILFVGTRPGQDRAVVGAAKMAGGCHLFERWTPGAITNASQILGRGKVVEMDMRDRVKVKSLDPTETTGGQSKPALDVATGQTVKPDLVVCLNPLENYILLHECGLYAIPTIGVIDTDADPTWVTYPIPANDDRYVTHTLPAQQINNRFPLSKQNFLLLK